MTNKRVIELEGVSFAYDGVPVLDDVNLTISEREAVCIVGPNGGGKTTLLKLMLGLLRPSKGTVRVFGAPPGQAYSRIGYVPQNYQCDLQFPVRVIDVVLMGRLDQTRWLGPYRRADREAARRALEEVALSALRHRPFAALSGGQRQRVLIARALATEPAVLMLDEPTTSLDLAAERELHDLLVELNKRLTIVTVSHDVGFVSRFVTKVVCVKGRVVVHPTSELTGDMICDIYASDILMVRHDRHHPGGGA